MPLKTTIEQDGKKYALLNDDGNPIYEVNGKDVPYDGEKLAAKLTQVNGEAESRRKEVEELKDNMKKYEGIEDPAEAVKALETVKNLDDKKLIDAGEVEKIKTAAISAVEEKWNNRLKNEFEPITKERDELKKSLEREMIANRFAGSKFIEEKMSIPAEMVQSQFGHHFSIEEGKPIYRDSEGNEIYSRSTPGEKAGFDEALELIIDKYPHKDQIMVGTNNKGSGSRGDGGDGGKGNEEKTMTRAEAEKLGQENPSEMMKRMKEGWTVVDNAA